MFEIKKFVSAPVFFTDRKKVSDFALVIKSLPKNSTIIIREYDLDKNSRQDFAQKIVKLAQGKYLKILVGKDFNLAKKIKADGVHFSDFDKLPLQFLQKKSFPKKFIFSFACHNFKSIKKSAKFKPNIIFISPVFATTSHFQTKELGIKTLAKIVFKIKSSGSNHFLSKIYALGGINLQNIKQLKKLPIQGFAAINLFKENL